MKKIGVMTFHRAANYGAVLQAYALSYVLQALGNDVKIIDYRCQRIENLYDPFSAKAAQGLPGKIKKLLRWNQLRVKGKRFAAFREKYLALTVPCYNQEQLKAAARELTVCVTGSDQVFNLQETGGDRAYLLDFADGGQKKLAYAASFGTKHMSESDRKLLAEQLQSFDGISVRESSAVELARTLSGKQAALALDPVLLLHQDVWEKLWKKPKHVPENYVLAYMMAGSDALTQKAYQLGENVVIVNPTLKQQLRNRDCRQYPAASPEEFLWLFGNAHTVVTNSFHGLAFAIVFRKDFYVELTNKDRAGRLQELLALIGLEDRILPCKNPGPIDWERVEGILTHYREQSLDFLQKGISDGTGIGE